MYNFQLSPLIIKLIDRWSKNFYSFYAEIIPEKNPQAPSEIEAFFSERSKDAVRILVMRHAMGNHNTYAGQLVFSVVGNL